MKIRDLFFPPKCTACGTLLDMSMFSEPFCEHCMAKWEFAKRAAIDEHHGQPTRIFSDKVRDEYGQAVFVLYYEPRHFENIESKLLFSLKDRGEERSVNFVARELLDVIQRNAPFLKDDEADAVIVWIPRRIGAVRACGFDHMEQVAICLSKCLSIPAEPVLRRRLFTLEQKYLTPSARRRNAYTTMKLAKDTSLENKTVILIDDIITTGASLDAAASLLMSAGAKQVIAAVLCAAEHKRTDKYRTENGFNIIKSRKSKQPPADFKSR